MEEDSKLSRFMTELSNNDIFSCEGPDEFDSYLDNHNSLSLVSTSCSKEQISLTTSVSTNVTDDPEEVKILRRKLKMVEEKCQKFEEDNTKISTELFQERSRISKMRSKLEFVKENQDVFLRLKEAYINMKYNESAGRKMVEVKEKGCQTYEGVLCKACIKTEQLRRTLDNAVKMHDEARILYREELERLTTTASYIRDMIQRREKQWGLNLKRESQFKEQISVLECENERLKDATKYSTCEINNSVTGLDNAKKELHMFKKIVIKLEKRYREMLKRVKSSEEPDNKSYLDDKEKKIVSQLIDKYYEKTIKTREKYRSRSKSKSMTRSRSHSCADDKSNVFTQERGMANYSASDFLREKGLNRSTRDVSVEF